MIGSLNIDGDWFAYIDSEYNVILFPLRCPLSKDMGIVQRTEIYFLEQLKNFPHKSQVSVMIFLHSNTFGGAVLFSPPKHKRYFSSSNEHQSMWCPNIHTSFSARLPPTFQEKA